jgi:ABC-type dipeptide/oligopeptide/nickel transport system ATPase component
MFQGQDVTRLHRRRDIKKYWQKVQGELVEQGSMEKVLGDPQHEYTQRLLADVPRLRANGRNQFKSDKEIIAIAIQKRASNAPPACQNGGPPNPSRR